MLVLLQLVGGAFVPTIQVGKPLLVLVVKREYPEVFGTASPIKYIPTVGSSKKVPELVKSSAIVWVPLRFVIPINVKSATFVAEPEMWTLPKTSPKSSGAK